MTNVIIKKIIITAEEMQTVMSHNIENSVMIEEVSLTVTLYMYIFLTAFFNSVFYNLLCCM